MGVCVHKCVCVQICVCVCTELCVYRTCVSNKVDVIVRKGDNVCVGVCMYVCVGVCVCLFANVFACTMFVSQCVRVFTGTSSR